MTIRLEHDETMRLRAYEIMRLWEHETMKRSGYEIMRLLLVLLECLWGPLGTCLTALGASWGALGRVLGALREHSGTSLTYGNPYVYK